MWTDNTRNEKIKGDQIDVYGYENIDPNIFSSKLMKVK